MVESGLEVATPERDNGIDLIAYRWNLDGYSERTAPDAQPGTASSIGKKAPV
jgi:hypothetical protein